MQCNKMENVIVHLGLIAERDTIFLRTDGFFLATFLVLVHLQICSKFAANLHANLHPVYTSQKFAGENSNEPS